MINITMNFKTGVAVVATAFTIFMPWLSPAAIPKGNILLSSNSDGDYELYTMKADGTERTQLTNNSDIDSLARYSPDHSQIVFVRNTQEIWLMDSDGSNERFIHDGKSVDFSPSGQQLVFSDYGGEFWAGDDLFIYDLQTKQVNKLISPTGSDTFPDWSPDGEKIVFINKFAYFGDSIYNIHLVNTDGSGHKELTDYDERDDITLMLPRWSPDGSKIAYQGGSGSEHIHVMDADGTNHTTLTSGLGGEVAAVWSPDGNFILFSGYDKNDIIYIMNSDGTDTRILVNDGSNIFALDWIADTTTGNSSEEEDDDENETVDPIPNIKANGLNEPVTITSEEPLSITIELAPGSYDNTHSDWWVVQLNVSSGEWYYYEAQTNSWVSLGSDLSAISVSYQGPLFNLPSFELFNSANLLPGSYQFYFGIDQSMNGVLDEALYYDQVSVTVLPSGEESSSGERVGHWASDMPLNAVALAEHYAYVLDDNQLHVIDVVDPSLPTQMGVADVGGFELALMGNNVVIASPEGVSLVDVSIPENPIPAKNYEFRIYKRPKMGVKGETVYIIESTLLITMDLSDRDRTTFPWIDVGSGAFNSDIDDLTIIGNYIYLVDNYDMGLQVWDISKSDEPSRIHSGYGSPFFGYNNYTFHQNIDPHVVDINANIIGVTTGNRLDLVDVSNPETPIGVSSLTLSDQEEERLLVANGNYVYVLSPSTSELQAIDVSDATNPNEVTTYQTATGVVDISANNTHVFVVGENELSVYAKP